VVDESLKSATQSRAALSLAHDILWTLAIVFEPTSLILYAIGFIGSRLKGFLHDIRQS
jgi:hypothetical protein